MKKEKLERRQYRYKLGSVVKFTKTYLNSWYGRSYKKSDIGIVTSMYEEQTWRTYQVEISIWRDNEIIEEKRSVYKGKDVNLLSYNDAMVESL